MSRPPQIWLHRFAVFLAGATLFLITAGASVTSTGSGLAVPDWPLSFGQFFPAMEGGVLYEHGHRMIAGVVLVLTVILVVWLARREERVSVRRLGYVAMLALVAQAVLGGLTVLFLLPTPISVSHAALAEAFLCMIVSIALLTSPGWGEPPPPVETEDALSLRRVALITTGVVYVQILLGAVMRHMGAGLAIPDFPLSYGRVFPPFWYPHVAIHYAHRVGALVVTIGVAMLLFRIMKHHRGDRQIARPAVLLGAVLTVQIFLGALTIWSKRAVIPTTAHVAVGAATLATTIVITLRSFRLLRGRA